MNVTNEFTSNLCPTRIPSAQADKTAGFASLHTPDRTPPLTGLYALAAATVTMASLACPPD
ncbi:hypothetical protein [Oleidesulfovibrio alaskensis]|uniref:hypothetical protein n=1 Tax=Oleidesulfovibrio alaskensis TaxID=58180 RepID=UPI00030CEC4A|nr:hypothetical protein [Oleidesulfovibrio alaskensis]